MKYPIDTVSKPYGYKETETETEKKTQKKEKDRDREKDKKTVTLATKPASNRKARRASGLKGKNLQWGKVVAQGSYDELGEGDARDLLMTVFRAVAGQVSSDVFDDRSLFDSTMTLIRHDFITIWMAIDESGVQVKFQLNPVGAAA